MKTIKLKIPATTANFGSGFDVFGASLKLYNEIEIEQLKIENGKLIDVGEKIFGPKKVYGRKKK